MAQTPIIYQFDDIKKRLDEIKGEPVQPVEAQLPLFEDGDLKAAPAELGGPASYYAMVESLKAQAAGLTGLTSGYCRPLAVLGSVDDLYKLFPAECRFREHG